MSLEAPQLSADFQRLYCDPTIFTSFSALHPIRFSRVLPFQHPDEGVDDGDLLRAEANHLARQCDATRLAVVDEYSRCGLIEETEAGQLRAAIDFFDEDFFELMGMAYANVGRSRCALRWYGELIRRLETQNPNSSSDTESVYASVGYCLYSLWLFEEAIAWSKACIGPRQTADAICRALIDYEAELTGGATRAVERSGSKTRYTASSFEPEQADKATARLKAAMKGFAPFQDVYLDWISHDSPKPEICPEGYPFSPELDAGALVRHKMNLIFATCCHADALMAKGYHLEAKRLLWEAQMLEPAAGIIVERLRFLP